MDESVRSTPSYLVCLARSDEAEQVCEVCTEGLGAAGGGVVGDGIGQIYVLYLRMALRGRGVGSALVDFLTEQEKRLGAVEQGVSVTEGNDLGIPFYLAKRFVMKDRVPFVTDDEGNVEAWSLRLARAI